MFLLRGSDLQGRGGEGRGKGEGEGKTVMGGGGHHHSCLDPVFRKKKHLY